nr:MAG TPA: hypothetical protein [Caudoviricetes sp.]
MSIICCNKLIYCVNRINKYYSIDFLLFFYYNVYRN